MENEKILAKFWKKNKYKSNLTLSVKLHEQDFQGNGLIKEIQEIVINDLRDMLLFHDPYDLKNKGGLFVYAEDRFHFSPVNFLKSFLDFDMFFNKNKDNDYYSGIKEEIINIINEHLTGLTSSIRFRVESLYKNDEIDSISLQAYSTDKDFREAIIEIQKDAEKKLNKDKIEKILDYEKEVKIKLWDIEKENPINYNGVINILRFIRSDNNIKPLAGIDLTNLMNRIQKKIHDNNLVFNINQLSLVESDPFLFKWNKVESFNLSEISK